MLGLSAVLVAIGFATGQLAANERLFRLIAGPSVIRHYGRYLARTSGSMAGAQVANSFVLAVAAPLGWLAFAGLYAASSMLRLAAHRAVAPEPAEGRAASTAGEPISAVAVVGAS